MLPMFRVSYGFEFVTDLKIRQSGPLFAIDYIKYHLKNRWTSTPYDKPDAILVNRVIFEKRGSPVVLQRLLGTNVHLFGWTVQLCFDMAEPAKITVSREVIRKHGRYQHALPLLIDRSG